MLHFAIDVLEAVVELPAPSASFVEAAVELPAGTREVAVDAEDGLPYRVFHWFVLQP